MDHQDDYVSRYESTPIGVTTLDKQRQSAQKDFEKEKQRLTVERDLTKVESRQRESQPEITPVRPRERQKSESDGHQNSVGLIIGNQLANLDPVKKSFLFFRFY